MQDYSVAIGRVWGSWDEEGSASDVWQEGGKQVMETAFIKEFQRRVIRLLLRREACNRMPRDWHLYYSSRETLF